MKLKRNKIIGVFFFSSLVLLDQLSKYIIRLKGGFYICNPGIAFGINNRFIILFLFIILILFFLLLITNNQLLITNKNRNYKIRNFIGNWKLEIRNWNNFIFLAALLIFAGGFSNIIDRLYLGCVIDFINLPFWPAFNFADVFITLGFIILIIKIVTEPADH